MAESEKDIPKNKSFRQKLIEDIYIHPFYWLIALLIALGICIRIFVYMIFDV